MTAILLVDDDPLQAQVRKSVLARQFGRVERAADAAEAFIRVQDPEFAGSLGLVIVALSRPGMSVSAFVREIAIRLPGIPVLVVGRGNDAATLFSENVWTVGRNESPARVLAISRQMLSEQFARQS